MRKKSVPYYGKTESDFSIADLTIQKGEIDKRR